MNFYRDFTANISEHYTVFAIQSPILTETYRCLNNMSEIADIYLDYIKNVKGNGPYIVGGASFGGAVAHAITKKLIEGGEEVSMLFMIDTPGPLQKLQIEKKDIEIFAYLFGLDINFDTMSNEFFIKDIEFQIEYLKSLKLYRKLRFFSVEELKKIFNIAKDNITALQNYRPEKILQKIIFFLAKERDLFNPENPSEGWSSYTSKELDIISVPGNHISINNSPHVKHITNYIEAQLS